MAMLAMLCGLGCVVCWILVLLKMFPAEGALKGILAIICGLYAFIWGWMNAGKHNLKNIMLAWTVLILLSIVLNVVAGASMMPRM
jgi:hypothetical protein